MCRLVAAVDVFEHCVGLGDVEHADDEVHGGLVGTGRGVVQEVEAEAEPSLCEAGVVRGRSLGRQVEAGQEHGCLLLGCAFPCEGLVEDWCLLGCLGADLEADEWLVGGRGGGSGGFSGLR